MLDTNVNNQMMAYALTRPAGPMIGPGPTGGTRVPLPPTPQAPSPWQSASDSVKKMIDAYNSKPSGQNGAPPQAGGGAQPAAQTFSYHDPNTGSPLTINWNQPVPNPAGAQVANGALPASGSGGIFSWLSNLLP